MAAGLGFKDFTTGEVLTAADVDGYLMQGIWVFASAAARDAAVTSPQEGNACYLKDTNQVLTYSGSAWVAVGGGGSPLTTKGDVYGFSTVDARIPIGANNTVLTADSAEALGLKWAAPAASIPANATDTVSTANDVTSNSYTDPATSGPAVTLTTGTKALVIVTCNQKSVTASKKSFMGYAVSGATTIAATDTTALTKMQDVTNYGNERASAASVVTLTAGSNTFTAKYKTTDSDISTFADRTIFVMNLA